ncbi:helix-turn-helix transcriptional regulator [Serratia sp. M24T3]|uniref:helix-turn-helix domain-containing protein n=1 Tax=Serratia sp. M24T3 TaxID=932213 RepID=UPI00025B91F3|nr:helix-turn-helix transcriptional regulator [Serratia sp. M24T3]EIC82711.1 bacteriophage protein [Serratia sp. M24T3]
MYKKQKLEVIQKNIKYLLTSRGKTRVSLCDRTGLNRTTIYNILDGRVLNIHKSTIQKVSDFFGVSYKEIENLDLAEREHIDTLVSSSGNMNPCAVPLFLQSECISMRFYYEKIGLLVSEQNLTFYFGHGPNVIGIILESDIPEKYNSGDLLIIKRGNIHRHLQPLCYEIKTNQFSVKNGRFEDTPELLMIGEIIEERYNYGK